ncbi:MAG: RIP metalloprotease RseP [Alistipes sp.]|nr:RIP metalloprotease RseP [Alistipes sp.]MBR3846028.1 RIP metalloprotease RseP [Alistipes sp.]MBR7169451.1 RIP metalloprotease RseP [Alistipes sp.]
METLIKILQFFLCFTVIVGLHEFGHYAMARLFKIRVEKFYIFFDPWFSLFKFKYKGTEYGLGWLPLGGYVKIGGMIDESMDKEQMAQPVREDDFRAKPAWQRFLVMIAGVVMNLITAVVIYCAVCYVWGESYLANEDIKLGYTFNQAAHDLGFEDGDRILSIDEEPIDNYAHIATRLLLVDSDRKVVVSRGGEELTLTLPFDRLVELRRTKGYENFATPRLPMLIDSVTSEAARALLQRGDEVIGVADCTSGMDLSQIREAIKQAADTTVLLHVQRGDEVLALTLPVASDGTVGIQLNASPLPIRTREFTLLESIPAGFKRAGATVASYWEQLKLIVQPETKMYEELGGFIAIGSIFAPEWNWLDFWLKTAFLSIILAVMNILPIPGLDGGHALFTFWEMITGRKVSDRVLEIAQYIGLAILLLLLLYANGNDIYRFFVK